MKIKLVSIPVRDQQKALEFYRDKLGFVVKHDTDLGNGNRWLTLLSKDQPDGPELLLEPGPLHFEPCKVYQDALLEVGMPYAQLYVDNLKEEYDRLRSLGVSFSVAPKDAGTVLFAIFNDTCGNNIQLVEEK